MGVAADLPPGRTEAGVSPQAWYAIGVFALAAMLSYTDRLILNLLVSPIRAEMAITDTQVSFLQGAAFAVIYSIAGLPMGRHADRHGRRNLILAGVLVWSFATLLCGLAQSYGQLFAARILVGVGEAALAPAALSMIPDLFPAHRRGTAVGIFLAGMVMGGGTATLTGGVLIELYASGALSGLPLVGELPPWRAVLVTLGLVGGVMALLVLPIREPQRRESLGGKDNTGLGPLLRYMGKHRAAFVLLLGGLTLTQLVDYGTNSWTPSLLMRVHGFSAAETGAALGGILIGVAGLGTVSGGILADFLEQRGVTGGKLIIAALATSLAVPCMFFSVSGSTTLLLTLFGLFAFLLAVGASTGIAAVLDLVPSELRGMTTAIQAFLFTAIGLGMGPTVVALTTDHVFGDPNAVGWSILVTCMPLMALAALALWRAKPHYRRTRQALADRTSH
ncbi:MFS transporter [Niveispirillum irakense]|uniref:MFS transporter n=1 Tax=Niveispirillum irakense TaxID=34011 RepID=UPI0003FBABFA|nr:MFS transporter [Niveispirillum irakense]